MIRYCYLKTMVGRLLLAGDDHGLRYISFTEGKNGISPNTEWREDREFLREAIRQLDLYFDGRLTKFALNLAPQGTPFQLRVLQALQEIPYGETISYRELAERIGKPKASRAVGSANARNPLPIVIPCHRVIGSNGNLVGFGGGLEIKRKLLDLESTNR
ncbi:MAG: methylated-DNA--[protein]-cysteine S-methyltransferase [Thermodesulfobacteriota bacterium]